MKAKSPLSWVGGKSRLTDQIIPLMPAHHCYVEVFAGAAWLLFRKEPSKVEIINDINKDLVTLYRVIQNHPKEFIRLLKWQPIARCEFDRFVATDPQALTDIQRAVRFYYIIKTGYGSKTKNPSFGITPSRQSSFNPLSIAKELSNAHLRLSRVFIENKPYQTLLTRHDRDDTFFYIDPPYFGFEDFYGDGIFSRDDFAKLKDLLANVNGKFIMSINDTPEIRDLYKDFRIKEVKTKYSVNKDIQKNTNELLILNFNT